MRTAIDFVINGEARRIEAIDPTMTVMRYLRETARLTGTKEGCAEGDCGACTAVLATLDGDALQYRAINTCIQFVGMLDGKALITVEHLQDADGLHPVQAAMAETNASQCGFCTPGFVMSLFAGYQQQFSGGREEVDTLLAGNLCRCTGYTAILNAAARVIDDAGERNCFAGRERRIVDQIRTIRSDQGLHIESAGRSYIAPSTLAELSRTLKQHPGATIVAGATDVGLFVTKQHRRIETLVDIGRIGQLAAISSGRNGLRLGAAVTYLRAQGELAALYPETTDLVRRLGSVQVRNLGTIGGNIANGSPIGDMPPVLIAAGAQIRLRSGPAKRDLDLENYFIAYGQQDRRPAEFLESIFIPRPKARAVLKVYKVSKRFDQDISSVCGAFHLTFGPGRHIVRSARICFGGMAAIPSRALACERFLAGKPWTDDVIAEATEILRQEFQPISDWRASAQYRVKIAGNLLRRAFLETSTEQRLQLSGRKETIHAG